MQYGLACAVLPELVSGRTGRLASHWRCPSPHQWEPVQIVTASTDSLAAVDPAVLAQLFGFGFTLFTVPWAAAWGFSYLLNSIRRF